MIGLPYSFTEVTARNFELQGPPDRPEPGHAQAAGAGMAVLPGSISERGVP